MGPKSLYSDLGTRNVNAAAISNKIPPQATANDRSLPRTFSINQPKPREAIISGSTIKKLNIPINNPTFLAGKEGASMAYGIERILAHAIPTPVIDKKSKFGLFIKLTEQRPSAPKIKQVAWVNRLPYWVEKNGNDKAKRKVTKL